jgi:hypothetical protein
MEFFKIVKACTTEQVLKDKLSNQNLEEFCESTFFMEGGTDVCLIGGMWGEFTIRRDEIMGGVRFSMLDCPNALTWSITTGYPPAREDIVVHLCVNRQRKPEEFVEEIYHFLDDMESGLSNFINPGKT